MIPLDHVNEYSALFLKKQNKKTPQVYFSREFTELTFVNSMQFTHLMWHSWTLSDKYTMGYLDIVLRWKCSRFSTASCNTVHYLRYLLLPYNIYSLNNYMDFRLSDWKMMGKNWGSLEVITQLSTSLLELHLSKTGQLTLEAGKCAQSDESVIPSFYIITIEAVYGQVFCFFNL